MKVAMVCADRRPPVYALARHLAVQQHDVTIFRRDDGGAAAVDEEPRLRETVIAAGPAEPLDDDALLDHMAALGHALADAWNDDVPQVVHAHAWTAGVAAQVGARPLGLPVVQSFHELGIVRRRHLGSADSSPSTRVRLERSLALASARVLAGSSDEVFELFRMGVPHRKSTVLPIGVDTAHFERTGSHVDAPRVGPGLRIIAPGPTTPERGHVDIVRALAAVPGAHLVIEDDLMTDEIRNAAIEARVTERVRAIPVMSSADLYHSADLVAVVPWFEPSGQVALEAMACGLPVLATTVGALVDIVVDGITGSLVPPRRPDSIATALRRMTDDHFGMQAMGVAGADRAANRFSWDRVAEETARVYRAVGRRALPVAATR